MERVWIEANSSKLWWECKLAQPLWGTVWRLLKNLKMEIPYDPAIPLPGIYLEKNMVWKDTCTPVFIAALFTIAKTWMQHKYPSIDEWIKSTWYIHTMEYHWNNAICSNINKPGDYQTERDKYHLLHMLKTK